MVNNTTGGLDATFQALADPTRRGILARLALGDSSVTELAQPFPMSLPAVSKHLRVLENAGLLSRERDGRVHRCRLEPRPLHDASAWIARYRRFWQGQLDALARYLDETKEKEETAWPRNNPSGRRRSSSAARWRRRGSGSSGRGRSRRS